MTSNRGSAIPNPTQPHVNDAKAHELGHRGPVSVCVVRDPVPEPSGSTHGVQTLGFGLAALARAWVPALRGTSRPCRPQAAIEAGATS